MVWQLEHHQTLCHQVVSGLQAKNEKLAAEVVELKQKLDAKEQHHHHHKKCKRPNTLAVAAYEDPLMQEPLEKKAKADKTEDKILAKGLEAEAARPSVCKLFLLSITGVLLVHNMELERPTKSCDKCCAVLGPVFKCITCALHVPLCNVEVCMWCIRHLWTNADHSGHIWQVVYQPTDVGVVVESLRPWLQA
ncbi:uncharacterized protein ACA1_058470 [Acanthamoeba castellanii str. Neff]|uniref:Uncharacterized protein n=1 Tax=Acanthamoeba castellanii (strain ATCC 30010 / Neff) TaxID=1257118 RepID=L8GYK9_ACACF|nr:uncharacterized protein ACA1_058470 [Acanthamoeba castellanii str. Neff]ELR17191.1 hypothetical protein ACA1_058470 [Acanthamoeba castellanii str. Neff]